MPLLNQMVGCCRDRGFEGLLGYVDIDVIAAWEGNELVPYNPPEKWAYPCCELEAPAKEDTELYEVLMISKNAAIKAESTAKLDELVKLTDEA